MLQKKMVATVFIVVFALALPIIGTIIFFKSTDQGGQTPEEGIIAEKVQVDGLYRVTFVVGARPENFSEDDVNSFLEEAKQEGTVRWVYMSRVMYEEQEVGEFVEFLYNSKYDEEAEPPTRNAVRATQLEIES